jgi:hypothetical protein
MLRTYEATYTKGKLKWRHGAPAIEDGCPVIVVAEAATRATPSSTRTLRAWDEARGVWGNGKSLADVDRQIEKQRGADWSRGWGRKP